MAVLARIQPALTFAARHRGTALSLTRMAGLTGLSPYQFHRAFAAIARETPKQFTDRLRLDHAAALLLSTHRPVLDIAFACGYQSHEVFLRAFRRRFHTTPQLFRRNRTIPADAARRTSDIAACLHLYRYMPEKEPEMTYTIETRELAAQPILSIERRVKVSEIAATIGPTLGVIMGYAMQHGCALNGHPITRYGAMGAGMVTMEPAMRVAQHPPADPTGQIRNETLPAGLAAVTTHVGPYDGLHAAYAALEVWMHDNGYQAAGAPWEDYVTDPTEVPNPSDWRTDVYWPICKA